MVSVRPGFYKYAGRQKPLSLIEKMWRAIRIKEYFTRRDIVRLSGASNSHVHKYMMHLEAQGIIENVSGGRGYSEGIFGLINPDTVPLEHPVLPFKGRKKK